MIPGRELLTARTVGWNVALLLVVGMSAFIAVFLGGASWAEIGAQVDGAVALGAVMAAVVTPISRRRFQRLGVARPAAHLQYVFNYTQPVGHLFRAPRPIAALACRVADRMGCTWDYAPTPEGL